MENRYPRQASNFIAYGIDVISFGLGFKFFDPYTVLPTLATQLGASSSVIGILITAFFLAWSLPQLAAGNVIARYPRKKPTLLRMAFIGRPVLFVFAFLLFTGGADPPWLYLILLFDAGSIV
jgi:MFS family permease